MSLRLQCRCGVLRGQVRETRKALRGVCYCTDCRAYSHHLGLAHEIHDTLGGLEFVATQAHHISLEQGADQLACGSLSQKGLLRWTAKCCNTPIANTVRNWKFPYVGLMHTGIAHDRAAYEQAFPRVQMRVNTASALAPVPAMRLQSLVALAGFMPRVLAGAFAGSYRDTPFFLSPTGQPVAKVDVLSKAENAQAHRAARGLAS